MPSQIRAERRRLVVERAALERRIARLSLLADEIERAAIRLKDIERRVPRGPEPLLPPRSYTDPARQRVPRGALSDGILGVLEGQREMHLGGIVDALAASGVLPLSANPRASVQSTLWALAHKGRVVNRGRNVWALL